MYDVIVIGGGPAGLQAGLTLGRMHRSVLLLDSGVYRNATVEHMHNYITHDGRDPAELRALARKDLAAYDSVEVREVSVDAVRQVDDTFEVVIGDEVHGARSLVLATGMRDTLPDVQGVAEAWGREIAHCPYCDGHELSGQKIAILGSGFQSAHLSSLLVDVVGEIVVLANGGELETADAETLQRLGVGVRPDGVLSVEQSSSGLRIELDGGESLEVAGMFVAPEASQSSPFAEQLGLTLLPSGCIEIDAMGRTSLPGVFAAGDLAHSAALPGPMPSVAVAVAAGLVAGSVCNTELTKR